LLLLLLVIKTHRQTLCQSRIATGTGPLVIFVLCFIQRGRCQLASDSAVITRCH